LARTCENWRLFAEPYQSQMKQALQHIAAAPNLSDDVGEIVRKALHLPH
jgi:aminopeptidase N